MGRTQNKNYIAKQFSFIYDSENNEINRHIIKKSIQN